MSYCYLKFILNGGHPEARKVSTGMNRYIRYFQSHSRLISGPNQCVILADTYSVEIRVNARMSPATVCLLNDQVETINIPILPMAFLTFAEAKAVAPPSVPITS